MSEDINISVSPAGDVAVTARSFNAYDLPTMIVEIDTRGVFLQPGPLALDQQESLTGLTKVTYTPL